MRYGYVLALRRAIKEQRRNPSRSLILVYDEELRRMDLGMDKAALRYARSIVPGVFGLLRN